MKGKAGNRGTEGHKLWLFDLAHGNLEEDQIVRGFIKYYALEGCQMEHVQNDLVFRTACGAEHSGYAMESLREALEKAAESEKAAGQRRVKRL